MATDQTSLSGHVCSIFCLFLIFRLQDLEREEWKKIYISPRENSILTYKNKFIFAKGLYKLSFRNSEERRVAFGGLTFC